MSGLPKLYAILDRETLDRRGVAVRPFAAALREAGVRLVQYRDKSCGAQDILRAAAEIKDVFAGSGATLILNDRADLCVLAGWDGVHVGQGDLLPADARKVLGSGVIGVSTHDEQQVLRCAADDRFQAADYVAIGPVFGTATKADAEPMVGLEGLRRARVLTARPVVAIGGITLANAMSVVEAGADSVAVISGLMPRTGAPLGTAVREFMALLGE